MAMIFNRQRPLLGAKPAAETPDATFSRRTVILGLANAAVFGGLAARLYDLQVMNGPLQAAVAEDNRSRTIWLAPMRGRILDATGEVLASSNELYRIVLYPQRGTLVSTPGTASVSVNEAGTLGTARFAADLAPLLGLDPAILEEKLSAASHGNRQAPLVLAEALTFADVAALKVGSLDAINVVVEPQHARVYTPLPAVRERAMAHIIGHVGAIDRFNVDDEPHLRLRNARVGKTGVEAGMEVELQGIGGRATYEIDARGRHVRRISERAGIAGHDVMLSIDMRLQEAVVRQLAEANDSGAAVVLDVRTGAILALASTPAFDAGRARSDPGERRRLETDPARPLFNRATTGQYPPGSTFKLVTALAALEAGLVTSREKIECWGAVTYAGQTFRCWSRTGHVASDLHKAVRESCDCYFYEAARRTGIQRISAMARELGLGQVYPDAGIAPQRDGVIPDPGWKRRRNLKTGWLLGETILAGIGQGYVQTTPLQLAVMTARIASGRKVVPSIVKLAAGDPLPAFEPLAISQTHLEALRRALKAVVNEGGGTGHAADPGDGQTLVAGKTGTSQVASVSADRDRTKPLKREHRDHALFVAYAPADAPRWAIATVLEHAGSGGAKAGPLVAALVRVILAHEKASSSIGPSETPVPVRLREG